MKCDFCGIRESSIFVQQMSAGKKIEIHLCADCAKERGINAQGGKLEMSFAGLLAEISAMRRNDIQLARLCPVCGQSLGQLKKTNTAGCPECYGIFAEQIQDILCIKDGHERYAGSLPKRLANFRSVLTDRMLLRSKLEESVANEDYERAALYRDRLKAMEGCAVADGSEIPEAAGGINEAAARDV